MSKLYGFLAACMRTRYEVALPDGNTLVLQIGEPNMALDDLLRRNHASTFGYLTACNPQSTSLSSAENASRHAQLCADLDTRGWQYLTGQAVPDTDEWEPETCVFVLNMPRAAVGELCRAYEQDAAVVGDWGSAPKLYFTRRELREDFLKMLHSFVLD